jgi:hypothetical protein
LKLKFEYKADNDSEETGIEFSVRFTEIIEYIDDPVDGYYNESIDEAVQVVKLDDFAPIVYTIEIISSDTVHVFAIETTDGVFSATIYATEEFTLVNDVLVSPTQLKIDVGIHNFDYNVSNSVLALKIKLESEANVNYEDDDVTEDEENERATDEQEVEIFIGDYSGFFSWFETATVDGVVRVVKASPIAISEDESILYLNYPRGNEIIHDPKIGISGILQKAGFLGLRPWIVLPDLSRIELLIVSAVAFVAMTSLVTIFRRKKRA